MYDRYSGITIEPRSFNMTLFKDKEIVEDVRHLLTNTILRDIYDKSGTFTTIKMFKDANG